MLCRGDQPKIGHRDAGGRWFAALFLPYLAFPCKKLEVSGSACQRFWEDDGQTGVRRAKPACCRGCKSPTGKEVANSS